MRFPFWRRSRQEELAEEIESHLQMAAREREERGENPRQAEQSARREFGNAGLVREVTRDQWGWRWLETLLQDLRFALRMLRKSPGFTTVAVLTLALGIGANTAIFSMVDAALLRPLPFKDPDRVVTVWPSAPLAQFNEANGTGTLESAAQYGQGDLNLSGEGAAQRIPAAAVSVNFFRVFALNPVRGRTFLPSEGHAPVALLSYSLWRTRYHADPDILGKAVYLNGKAFTVIGVVPEKFDFPAKSQVWLSLPSKPGEIMQVFGGNAFASFEVARLRAHVTLEQARLELNAIAQREYGSSGTAPIVAVNTLRRSLSGSTRGALLMLFGAGVFVLLIACADLANLLLARGAGRSREIAIRNALGASRSRLVRQFLSESVVLSLMGGGIGLLLAWWTIRSAGALVPARTAFTMHISMNDRVLAFTFGIAVLTGILAGLIPALQSTLDLSEFLKEGSGSSQGGFSLRSRHRMRSLLGISEIALALVLLIGATLFLRSLNRLLDVNPGFQTDNILTARVSLLGPKYENEAHQTAFFRQVLARVRALPGVRAAAFVNAVPLGATVVAVFPVKVENPPRQSPGGLDALYMTASSDYFRAMGIPLLAGRDFTAGDAAGTTRVAIISRSLAQAGWPGENALGQHFAFAGEKQERQVVGIVGDVRHFGLSDTAMPEMYFPLAQEHADDAYLIIHANRDPIALPSTVRDVVHGIDPDEPIASFETMDQLLSRSVAAPRLRTFLLTAFGALALLLALVGLYGVVSYTVAQRTHEIGVRMALGAERRTILLMVVSYALRLTIAGLAVGLVGAYFLTRTLSSVLYGIRPLDPVTFVLASIGLALVVLLASYIPARRAMRVDPIVALRYE
ncbi:MAG TPA: ABC transporter permease [Candidatus Acidoferrales bacterium]|nr:ABC transporter permease [Candidatus Acidoferrales bacterium]